jgi:hypothetical protein
MIDKGASCIWSWSVNLLKYGGSQLLKSPLSVIIHVWGETSEKKLGASVLNCWGSYPQTTNFPQKMVWISFLPFSPTPVLDISCHTQKLHTLQPGPHYSIFTSFLMGILSPCSGSLLSVAFCCDQRQQWPLVLVYVQGHFSERCVSCHCWQFKMWFMVAIANILWGRFISVVYCV